MKACFLAGLVGFGHLNLPAGNIAFNSDEMHPSHTLGKEIIPLLQKGHAVPFDQRPFRILFYEDNLDGYETLHAELPAWIASLSYESNPQMMIKNNMVDSFNDWRLRGKRVQFVRENFNGLNLKKMNLSDASLTETDFSGSDLTSGVFTKANLIRVDLSHAVLHDTDLREANLSEANLEKANFSGADLSNSIMLRANLNRAVFTGSDVRGLTIDYKTHQKFKPVFDDAINKSKIVVER